MFPAWQWTVLILLALLGGGVTLRLQCKAEAVAQSLSTEDRQAFNARYIRSADRAGMPAKFNDLAAAADRVRGARTGVTVIIAVALLIFVI